MYCYIKIEYIMLLMTEVIVISVNFIDGKFEKVHHF